MPKYFGCKFFLCLPLSAKQKQCRYIDSVGKRELIQEIMNQAFDLSSLMDELFLPHWQLSMKWEEALKGSVMLFGRINSLNAVSWVKGEVQILMLYWHQTFWSISYYKPITHNISLKTLNALLRPPDSACSFLRYIDKFAVKIQCELLWLNQTRNNQIQDFR